VAHVGHFFKEATTNNVLMSIYKTQEVHLPTVLTLFKEKAEIRTVLVQTVLRDQVSKAKSDFHELQLKR
jgi:hypothetical protein